MQSPAQSRGLRKATRDLFQAVLAVLAAGGATAVIDLILGSINSFAVGTMLAFVFKILIAYAQNYLETKGSIPTLLPAPGLITEAPGRIVTRTVGTIPGAGTRAGTVAEAAAAGVATTVGTVATTVDETGQLAGDVLDTAGEVVGGVTGAVGGLLGGDDSDDDDDDAKYTKEFDH